MSSSAPVAYADGHLHHKPRSHEEALIDYEECFDYIASLTKENATLKAENDTLRGWGKGMIEKVERTEARIAELKDEREAWEREFHGADRLRAAAPKRKEAKT